MFLEWTFTYRIDKVSLPQILVEISYVAYGKVKVKVNNQIQSKERSLQIFKTH